MRVTFFGDGGFFIVSKFQALMNCTFFAIKTWHEGNVLADDDACRADLSYSPVK